MDRKLQLDLFKKKYFIGLLLWLFFDFVGVNASGHYFGHQIKQLMPALSIVIAILISNLAEKKIIKHGFEDFEFTATLMLIFFLLILSPWQTLLKNTFFLATNHTVVNPQKELGIWLRDNTTEDDYVYLIGKIGNPILAYSERVSSSKYFNSIFITNSIQREIVLSNLQTKTPLFIIKDKLSDSISEILGAKIDDFITCNYTFTKKKYDYDIWKRNY